MPRLMPLIPMLLVATGLGCSASSGRTYRSADWKPGQPLGKVLVIVPEYRAESGEAQREKGAQIRAAVRQALTQLPGTTPVDDVPGAPDALPGPVSEAQAVEAGRSAGAETV